MSIVITDKPYILFKDNYVLTEGEFKSKLEAMGYSNNKDNVVLDVNGNIEAVCFDGGDGSPLMPIFIKESTIRYVCGLMKSIFGNINFNNNKKIKQFMDRIINEATKKSTIRTYYDFYGNLIDNIEVEVPVVVITLEDLKKEYDKIKNSSDSKSSKYTQQKTLLEKAGELLKSDLESYIESLKNK